MNNVLNAEKAIMFEKLAIIFNIIIAMLLNLDDLAFFSADSSDIMCEELVHNVYYVIR